MQASIHGHKVLNFIKMQTETFSEKQLLHEVTEHFGMTAQYHTCSTRDLSAEQLLQLFIEKGKLAKDGEVIRFLGCQCNH